MAIVNCAHDAMVPIHKLVRNPRNPNTHSDEQIRLLAKIIEYTGWRNPIVVSTRSGFIVKGHARLTAAEVLELEEVPVDYQDYDSEAQEWADMLADNRIAELAEIDRTVLKDLIEELDTGAIDIELTGFNDQAIEDLMTEFHVPGEGLTDDDAVPEKVETICKTGDLWQLGNHRLLCGDATKKEDVERLLGGEKADMVFTDPPYNVGFNYTKTTNDKKTKDEFQQFCSTWWELAIGVTQNIILTPGPRNEHLYPLPRDKGIWLKRYASAGASVFNLRCCEPILFYGDGYKKRNFDYFDYSSGFPKEMTEAQRASGVEDEHPPAKPMKLWLELLDMKPSIITVDLFGGNGTTLIACEKLGRRCFMMEIDEHYCDIIRTRWEDFTGKEAVKLD